MRPARLTGVAAGENAVAVLTAGDRSDRMEGTEGTVSCIKTWGSEKYSFHVREDGRLFVDWKEGSYRRRTNACAISIAGYCRYRCLL